MISIEGPETGQHCERTTAAQPERPHSPCMGPHVFIWDELVALEKKPPEGLSCNCGMFEVHYSICDCGCGRESMSICFKHGRSEGLLADDRSSRSHKPSVNGKAAYAECS